MKLADVYSTFEYIPGIKIADLDRLSSLMDEDDAAGIIQELADWILRVDEVSFFNYDGAIDCPNLRSHDSGILILAGSNSCLSII